MVSSAGDGDDIDGQEWCRQFDEAIDVLEQALRSCPDDRWEASMWHVPRTDPWVWPAPGTEPIPERTDESIQQFSAFLREALLAYAEHGRQRVKDCIETTPAEAFAERCPANHPHAGKTLRELLQVNLAHVREHGTQMLEFALAQPG